jgi:colanic acid/amylovoran biosynthesis glycosyltransferase
MKVLIFVQTYISQTMTFVYNDIIELSKKHEVMVLTTEKKHNQEFSFDNVKVIPFKENKITKKLRWILERKELIFSKQNSYFKKELNQLIEEFKPDVIHSHFGNESMIILDNLNNFNIPIFISFHGYDASQMLSNKTYVKKLSYYLQKPNIHPLFVSNFIKENIIRAGVDINEYDILYCGTDSDFFTPPLQRDNDSSQFVFLQISSFNEKKGHIYTLRAFKLFLETVSNKQKYKLVLAGGWFLYDEIKAITKKMGLSDFVEFPGIVSKLQAKELLNKANVFLHHSITAKNGDTEGLPTVIIEAMAMELPVISSYHAGIPELVDDRLNGFLVPEKDVELYAQKMLEITSWTSLSINREKIVASFSLKKHSEDLEKIYKKTLHRKLNILHLFNNYPAGNTTNWLYNLITNTPNINVIIAAEYYSKYNFYNNSFTYIESPVASITKYKQQLPLQFENLYDKIVCSITEKLLGGLKHKLNTNWEKLHVNIAHAHFADLACDYSDFIKNKNIPLVVSYYGYDYEYLPFIKPEYIKKYKELFRKADKFICEGTHGASILTKMGCPPHKIEVIRLGVEIEFIPFQTKTKFPQVLTLVQIATLREKKGHIYSLKAFHKALKNCPNMHLTFVGSGEKSIYNELQDYVAVNNLRNHVTIIDEIDFNKLHHFISQFDVFIHPSCYSANRDCEGGAPIVLLDAQACGLPIISTTHCDIPDEVIHEKTGLLSPEKDIDGLTSSIQYFYNMDNIEYQSYSNAARKHVEEQFSIQKNSIKLKEVYDSLNKKNYN